MEDLGIREFIRSELSLADQKTALDFIDYLEQRHLTFYKDNCEQWKDKIYYWARLREECVCFIAIKDPDEKENSWTVWSDNLDSEELKNCTVDYKVKETAFKYIDHCKHCGSCSGGRTKIAFGKEFNDVCGCTFRIDNPTQKDLNFLKMMVDIRISEINSAI